MKSKPKKNIQVVTVSHNLKKIIALTIAAVLLLSILPGCGRSPALGIAAPVLDIGEATVASRNFQPLNIVGEAPANPNIPRFADQNFSDEVLVPRGGYILAPTMFGLTGIDPLSSFFLRTPADYTGIPYLSIDGQPPLAISREDSRTFLAAPTIALMPNSVYIFRLSRGDGSPDITWAFQTTLRFELLTSLPRHQSTNVPVGTGIEFNFSIDGETNIADHFSIYPHVDGRFIHRDGTAVFMPTNPLAYGQIYTVTLSDGIALSGSSEAISGQRMFSFETAPEQEPEHEQNNAQIHFPHRHVEFPTFAQPTFNIWVNYNREMNNVRPTMNITVHRIDNREYAISAINRMADIPHWSKWAHGQNGERLVDTSSLTSVYSTSVRAAQNLRNRWHWSENVTISQNLPAGFYVLTATTDGASNQVILQITDIATQVVADSDKTLVWVNDMTTGQPIAGAEISDPRNSSTFTASEYGIAIMDRGMASGAGDYIVITAPSGMASVVFAHSIAFQPFARSFISWHDPWIGGNNASDLYWSVLQLDRTLFQRSDTVNLWGFVQNRAQNENITHVTAVLTEHSWWRMGEQDTLHRQTIPVINGSYSGEVILPNLDPGSYELAIFHGDIAISSMFFSVQDYVKPPYQLLVSASHAAIFAGEEVSFAARTEFFEGTPVADLSVSYSFWGWELNTPGAGHGQRNTNINGELEFSTRPTAANANVQGERHLGFSAEATLPEIGWVHTHTEVRVFTNDIDVNARATRDDGNATLTVNVHEITLDRLNDGTAAHWMDYLCDAVAGQRLNVNIYRIYWVPIRDGERYCFINRQVVPRYRHERREERLQSFDLTTDANGEAMREFTVPDRRNESYEARVSTTDGNGRRITHNVFIGRDWSWFHWNADDSELFLDGAEASYDIGDPVELTVMQGTEVVTRGNFLFVVVSDGILSYHIGTNPLSFTFGEEHMPNTQVFAYHFNGHTYNSGWNMRQRLNFNRDSRQMNLEISTCQEEYRPGDTATITITTTDTDGNPKPANVNISLVDEALFALMNYDVDTLAALYRNINDSLQISLSTHQTFVSDGLVEEAEDSAMYGSMMRQADMAVTANAAPAAAPAAEMAGGASDTRIRERFEDTAVFKSLHTNDSGVATFTFELPDNITSWRITASALSNDLYAGNAVQNMRVTNPMFVHYTLSSTFLVGDMPTLGVNVFGTSLTGGEEVTFEVWREDAPTDIRRATGVSFERVNIPLWEMENEGVHAIVIRATVGNFSDAIRHEYQVVASHRLVDTAVFYDVTTGIVFDVNPGGLTNITFTDHGRSRFLQNLLNMRWTRGGRIEGLVASREATRLISHHFPDVTLFGGTVEFDVREYQQENGGISMLPYSSANLLTTVSLIPFVLDEVNVAALRNYLYTAFDAANMDNRMLALYGLALLGEPVLLELQRFAQVENMSVRNTAYIAMGLIALGEHHAALELYNSRIAPHVQRIAPYYRVNIGNNTRQIQDVTSVVSLLAAKLGLPQSIGLHNYAANRHTCHLALNLERLAFISIEIENSSATPASITYTLFGEEVTRDLSRGWSFTLRIPAQNMHEFELVNVTGDVGAVSIVRIPLAEIEPIDEDISIRREFFRAGTNTRATTFAQDELIRVQITIDYSRRAMHGSYVITDFLPAGLVHVAHSARFGANTRNRSHDYRHWAFVTTDGQRITFFDFNGRFDSVHTYYYYARVINPGVFKAEGPMVQSFGAREYMSVGDCVVITVQ